MEKPLTPYPVYIVVPDPDQPERFHMEETSQGELYERKTPVPLDRIFSSHSTEPPEEAKRRAEEWAERLNSNATFDAQHPYHPDVVRGSAIPSRTPGIISNPELPEPPAKRRRQRRPKAVQPTTDAPKPPAKRDRRSRGGETLTVQLHGAAAKLVIQTTSLLDLAKHHDDMSWLEAVTFMFTKGPFRPLVLDTANTVGRAGTTVSSSDSSAGRA